ncbi:uncharacterized protein BDZ99DRAFT_577755 [Mytilinidion resinicola]|uniref:Uncharacterized protein n=1 Tax=Mytilinidion resinicola TaxID=574789 RepID=A0A6A6XXJ2_9PEZI|nr:uncharacterized protein BDZ99DRAFT_577755 [Mytilinidion resinicola]KAF2801242.1 hypothetical protein BDZ99DRAFT_577755 [Mytilinidion resinicola]
MAPHLDAFHSLAAVEHIMAIAVFLQTKILICVLAAAGVWFLLGLMFLVLLKRNLKDRKSPSLAHRRFFKQATVGALWISVALALAGTGAVSQTSGALQYFSNSVEAQSIKVSSGTTIQALQWLVVAFSTIFAFGVSAIFKTADGTMKTATNSSGASGVSSSSSTNILIELE